MGLRFVKGSKDCVKVSESVGTFQIDSLYAMSQSETSLLTHCGSIKNPGKPYDLSG